MNYPRVQMLAEFIGQEVLTMKRGISILVSFLILLVVSGDCFAQNRFEITPSISVNETYDDNINLTKDNKVDDFITVVTPGIALALVREHTNLQLSYAPSIVKYADRDELDTTRHAANLSFGQDLSQHLRFDLSDSYLQSEDPLEDVGDAQGVRRTRSKYWTNSTQASLGYLFGAENRISAGYGLSYQEADQATSIGDDTLNNSKIQNPFAVLSYWFDVRNGMELNYRYTKADFSGGDNLSAVNDYIGHGAGGRYIRRFSPQTQAYILYNYSTRDFDGSSKDFDVHDGSVGLNHAFSPEYSAGAGAGYFVRTSDISEDQDGLSYFASLTKKLARGSVTIGGTGGWAEQYISRDTTSGFTKYYSGYARGDYQVLEPVVVYANASYRQDKEGITGRTWETLRGNAGLRWTFLRWFALSLDYSYAQRNDDISTADYDVNRVALILTASKLFIW